MTPIAEPKARLSHWLFEPIHATSLTLIRIVVGVMTMVWALTLIPDADPLLTWLRADPVGDVGWWQLAPSASSSLVVVLTTLLAVSGFLMAIGLWARAAAAVTFVLMLWLQRYNPAMLNGGDFILRSVLLVPLALSRVDRYLSVDALRRAGAWEWSAPKIHPWSIRYIQAHISLGYVLTVILKLRGETWLGGTAVWYAFGVDELTRFDVPGWISTGAVGAVLSWATLVIELGVGIGVWFRRSRPWVLAAGVALHLGIAVVFEIGLFSFVMVASYLAWLPDVPDVRLLIPRRWRRHGDPTPTT